MNNQRRYRAFGVYIAVIIILGLLWILRDSSSGFGQNAVYSYGQFEQDLEYEHVVSVAISQNREVPSGEAAVTLKTDTKRVTRTLYVSDVNALQETLKSYDFKNFTGGELADIHITHVNLVWRTLCILYYDDESCGGFFRRGRQDDEFWQKPCQDDDG